jgi:hypothetical protein
MTQDQFFKRYTKATFADYEAYLQIAINGEGYKSSIALVAQKLDSLSDQELWDMIVTGRKVSA